MHKNIHTSQVLSATRTRQALAYDHGTRVAKPEVTKVRAQMLAAVEWLVAHNLAKVERRVGDLASRTTDALTSMTTQ